MVRARLEKFLAGTAMALVLAAAPEGALAGQIQQILQQFAP